VKRWFARRLAWCCALCLPLPAQGAALRLVAEIPAAGLAFGEPFPLTVERQGRGLPAFDPASLPPLLLEPLGVEVLPDGERQRFRARCLATGEVRVADLSLMVRPALPAAAGDYELPIAPLPWPLPPRRWWWWVVAAVLAGFGLRFVYRRRSPAAPPAAAPPPADIAAALLALPLPSPGEQTEFFVALKALLREHCAHELGAVAAAAATSEQLCSRWPTPKLRAVLTICDATLFGRLEPDAAAIDAVLADAVAFVRATGPDRRADHRGDHRSDQGAAR
jgi:hypothetical protein